jgi:hypothetical protein
MAKNGMRIRHEQLVGIITYSQNDIKSSYGKIKSQNVVRKQIKATTHNTCRVFFEKAKIQIDQ